MTVIARTKPLARSAAQTRSFHYAQASDAVQRLGAGDREAAGAFFWCRAASGSPQSNTLWGPRPRVGHDVEASLPPCSYPCTKIRSVTAIVVIEFGTWPEKPERHTTGLRRATSRTTHATKCSRARLSLERRARARRSLCDGIRRARAHPRARPSPHRTYARGRSGSPSSSRRRR